MVDVLNNPMIQKAVRRQETRCMLIGALAYQVLGNIPWKDMTSTQREVCVQHIVSETQTKDELEIRLLEVCGARWINIRWHQPDLTDQTSREAQMLVLALGGLTSKSGAMVMVMVDDEMF